MRRFARLTTLLAGFTALQLSLLGASVACPMADHSGMRSASTTPTGPAADVVSMAGMDMPTGRALLLSNAPTSDEVPCDHTTAPGTCQTMAPCLSTVAVPAGADGDAGSVAPARVVVSRVLVPPSESAPPEPPPPRA